MSFNPVQQISIGMMIIGGILFAVSAIAGTIGSKADWLKELRTKGFFWGSALLGVGVLMGAVSSGAW